MAETRVRIPVAVLQGPDLPRRPAVSGHAADAPADTSGATLHGVVDDRVRDRVFKAIGSLVGCEPIGERLHAAGSTLLQLRPWDFPEGVQRDSFEDIRTALTKLTGRISEGHLGVSVRGMDDQMAVELARQIVSLGLLVAGDRSGTP